MGSKSSAPAPKIAPPAANVIGPDGLNIQPANLGEPVLAQQTAQQNYNGYHRQPGQWDYNQTNQGYDRYNGYNRHMNNPFPDGWQTRNQFGRGLHNYLQKRNRQPAPALAPPASQIEPPNPSPYG